MKYISCGEHERYPDIACFSCTELNNIVSIKKPECDHLYSAMEWETYANLTHFVDLLNTSCVTKIFCQKCLTKRDL